jgi:iron complex transport system ATP-binding protein
MINESVLLSTTDLRIGYAADKKENCLFENLTLDLRQGELVCLMGPNGIGKSSLIRTIAGLQDSLGGSIDIKHSHSKKSEVISVVLTDKITTLNMTVYDLVTFGRYPYVSWNIRLTDGDREIIDRAISHVHIEHLRDQKLSELSDGQLQMAMIARAFAQNTPIVLLDEPTAHLDLNNRVEIMKLLKSLARLTKKAILVSTHELDLALQMADLIWLAGRRKNMLTGIPEDLVLQGAFDSIFQFKGFDLKTGKVQHEVFQQKAVCLNGSGPDYLWTKNALERNGFRVTEEPQTTEVMLRSNGDELNWLLKKSGGSQTFQTLESLLKSI